MITCLVASSLLAILPASLAKTKPATPTFTIEEVSQKTFSLKIKNQPLMQPSDGSTIYLYHQARVKYPYDSDDKWSLVKSYSGTFSSYYDSTYFTQSDSQYTMLYVGSGLSEKIDIQVRAVVGTLAYDESGIQFSGVEGDWSRTQTLNSNQPTLPPTSTPLSNTSYPSITQNPLTPNQSNTDNQACLVLLRG